ncbi:MAG: alpha/beta hydrolase [Ferroplasma sp.]
MVDPDFKALIELSQNAADLSEMDPKMIRNFLDQNSLSMQGNKIPIKNIKDIKIKLKDHTLNARVYDDNDSSSAIIYFHGGGFLFGNIETYDNFCRFFAHESETTVISIEYRLAPENKFPAAFDDAFEAFGYINKNREKFSITGKIAVAGDSAGANLCAALSQKCADTGAEKPSLQVLFYPSLAPDNFSKSFMEYSDGYVLTGKMIEFFGKLYSKNMDDFINPYFSPIVAADFSKLPSTILISNEYDPLRDPEETYIKKIRSAGVMAVGIRGLGMIHGSATDFEISEGARTIVKMVARVIKDFL